MTTKHPILPLHCNGSPMTAEARDLLALFRDVKRCREEVCSAMEEVELSLGLSLGGNTIVRSVTMGEKTMIGEVAGVGRTCSLPAAGDEEEVRRRKEIQGLKRMEAKRRRLEKRDSRSGSQGSGSSVLSDLESHPSQGLSSKEEKSAPLLVNRPNHNAPTSPIAPVNNPVKSAEDDPSKKMDAGAQGMEKRIMEEMPCVSTRGDGPNGKRIQGFLYKYSKNEEVRIVCVCHGIFLTPAEFVKHAGGGDVANPLRHIVVSSPSPSTPL